LIRCTVPTPLAATLFNLAVARLPSCLTESLKNFLQNFAELAPRQSLVRGIISLILDCDGIGIEAASGLYAKGYEDARA
jgi:hypothetical protein